MQIDRMDLDECRTPEAIVTEIVRQIPNMPVPVPIEDLARAVDIVDIRRMDTPNFEGGLITQPERRDGMILVNSNGSQQRQRYTIGHEIGHFLMVSHQPATPGGAFMCSQADMAVRRADRDDRAARMEMEANRFSAGILMPLNRFRPDMEALGDPDLQHIFALAKRYDTSREATAIRYTGYHDRHCAVIIAKDNVVRRIVRPSRFPFIDVSLSRPLPTNSFTMRSRVTAPGWGEVDGGVWLGYGPAARGVIREQAYRGNSGWTYTLLVLEPGAAPDPDDEEDVPDVYDRFQASFDRR